jgi:hypothetical protein
MSDGLNNGPGTIIASVIIAIVMMFVVVYLIL